MILANLLSLSQQHSSESIIEMFFHQNVQPRYFNILDLTTRRIKDKIQNIRQKTERKIPGLSPRLRICKFFLAEADASISFGILVKLQLCFVWLRAKHTCNNDIDTYYFLNLKLVKSVQQLGRFNVTTLKNLEQTSTCFA